jgi:predicted transcriptional regulator
MALKNYQVLLNNEEILKLDKIAKSEERSRSFILREMIKKFLEDKGGKNGSNK